MPLRFFPGVELAMLGDPMGGGDGQRAGGLPLPAPPRTPRRDRTRRPTTPRGARPCPHSISDREVGITVRVRAPTRGGWTQKLRVTPHQLGAQRGRQRSNRVLSDAGDWPARRCLRGRDRPFAGFLEKPAYFRVVFPKPRENYVFAWLFCVVFAWFSRTLPVRGKEGGGESGRKGSGRKAKAGGRRARAKAGGRGAGGRGARAS